MKRRFLKRAIAVATVLVVGSVLWSGRGEQENDAEGVCKEGRVLHVCDGGRLASSCPDRSIMTACPIEGKDGCWALTCAGESAGKVCCAS